MPGRFLHVFELRAVLKRGRDEGRAHRVRRVAARKPDLAGVFPDDAVDLIAVPGTLKIGTDALCRLWVDRQSFAPSALADHAQSIEAPVLVKIAHVQGGDFGAAESDLQPNGENGAVAQAGDGVGWRRV